MNNSDATPVIEKQWQQTGEGFQADLSLTAFGDTFVVSAKSRQEKEIMFREEQPEPAITLYFSLEGSSAAYGGGTEKKLRPGQHMIRYASQFDGYYVMSSPTIQSFSVFLEASFFWRLMEADLECLKRFGDSIQQGGITDIAPQPLPVTARQQTVIREMQQCAYTGQMKRLYYESRITELFLLQAEQANSLLGKPLPQIRPADIEKLHAARDFVTQHMLWPLTLGQIAREAGLNDFKLKKGFKELFGTTVFGYLHELKMHHARELLLDKGCTVFEVADALGYSEPHNFSQAFKKHFGYLPGKLKG